MVKARSLREDFMIIMALPRHNTRYLRGSSTTRPILVTPALSAEQLAQHFGFQFSSMTNAALEATHLYSFQTCFGTEEQLKFIEDRFSRFKTVDLYNSCS